jgi:hypothetical protein
MDPFTRRSACASRIAKTNVVDAPANHMRTANAQSSALQTPKYAMPSEDLKLLNFEFKTQMFSDADQTRKGFF